jgi:hypothetical protein
MNNSPLSEESGNKFRWGFAFLAFLLFVGLVAVKPADLRRRSAEVRIDKNGTARLGGVLPLRNKKVRDEALRMASLLNGGKFTVVADKGAGWTNLVEVVDSIRKAGGKPSNVTVLSAQDVQGLQDVQALLQNTVVQKQPSTATQVSEPDHIFGVGLLLQADGESGWPRVAFVLEGTPAAAVHIKPGWKLLSINGTDTAQMSLKECINMVRGEEGTRVTLRLFDPSADAGSLRRTNTYTLPRFRINIQEQAGAR